MKDNALRSKTLDLYREKILDHYKRPRNFKRPESFDVHGVEANHLCGDSVELFLIFDKDGRVQEAFFQGSGCAISQASASMFTEKLKGMDKSVLSKISEKELLDFFEGSIAPGRIKCVLLPLIALHNGLSAKK